MCGAATHAVGWICRLRLAEGGLQGLGETRVGGGKSGGIGENGEHGVSFIGGEWKGSLKVGFQAGFLGISGKIVGWVQNPTKQMDFTVLLGLDPTYACYDCYGSQGNHNSLMSL